jgi:hypothetical protein
VIPFFLKARVRAFLKPLRDRRLVRSKVVELHLPLASLGPKSFTLWLAKQPTKERLRDIFPSARITGGLAQWPLGWLKKRGVICYERASGRVDSERGGVPDAAFMVGLVKRMSCQPQWRMLQITMYFCPRGRIPGF